VTIDDRGLIYLVDRVRGVDIIETYHERGEWREKGARPPKRVS
jgi:hypothetical protein